MKKQQGYSGRIMLRVPPFLHEKLARAAEEQGVSLNMFAQACLAEAAARISATKRIRRLQEKKEPNQ